MFSASKVLSASKEENATKRSNGGDASRYDSTGQDSLEGLFMTNTTLRTVLFVTLFLAVGCSERASEESARPAVDAIAADDPTGPENQGSSEGRGAGNDPTLYGVWIPRTYMYNGKAHKIDSGLMIITPTYLIANAIYDLSEPKKPKPDANANYGTYRITAPGQLVMDQAMQLHWRSSSDNTGLVEGDGTFFNQNVPEEIHYTVEGNTLTLRFQIPGEQSWTLEREVGETCSPSS